ncbi:BTB/POZ domain-containing protein At3g05675-like [Typha latifolia]|uniref:BTB/POZ domain-containing protein At3g05675-like n=1 Tax=Typha latifolia TaxID=4733 RepID=UPI003C2DEE62
MDQYKEAETYKFGDQTTSDIIVHLRNKDRRPEWFHCHSFILTKREQVFADWFSRNRHSLSNDCIEIQCSRSKYDHYAKLLKLLYLSQDSLLDSWDSVKSTLGILQASVTLQCESIMRSCIQYLEAVPWDEKEEGEIVKLVPSLGPEALPILSRIQPVNTNAIKNVFLSAIRFATTMDTSSPPLSVELKTSAQEQIEYMLLDDEETPLVAVDEDVKCELQSSLEKMFTTFKMALDLLVPEYDKSPEQSEQRVLQSLSDLEWICNILSKFDLMKDFISSWMHISDHVLEVLQDEKYDCSLWAVKAKLIEVTGKALEAIGYGSVILPAPSRIQFLKTWLPYIRKMKPLLDSKNAEDEMFSYKMDGDLCQNIEGAIVSLVLALPSSDQADVLADWINRSEQLNYPDLSEAFDVWSYRTKTAKRRLMVGLNGVGNQSVRL